MAQIAVQDYNTENRGNLTNKELRSISSQEVEIFNLDYNRLIDQEITARAKRMLEEAREYVFELVRHVMNRANQNYGGATAEGDEIGTRLIRPDDMEMGVAVATGTADSWNFTWTATGDQDLYGTAGDPVNMGDNATAESLLIVGWTTNHPSPKTEAIQGTKFGRDLFAQPLPWDLIGDTRGGVKVMEANPWFVAFPGETFTYDVNVFATGTDTLRALGVYTSIGTNIRNIAPAA